MTRDKRYTVNTNSQVEGLDGVFAIGDVASMASSDYERGHPMLAPVAIQQGELLAKNMNRGMEVEQWKPFKYHDKGTMATIGRNKAVTEVYGKLKFGGFFAWLMWMFVHLVLIVEFRNKLVIFSNWVWNYFTYDRGTRLIVRPFVKKNNKKETNKEDMPVATEVEV